MSDCSKESRQRPEQQRAVSVLKLESLVPCVELIEAQDNITGADKLALLQAQRSVPNNADCPDVLFQGMN